MVRTKLIYMKSRKGRRFIIGELAVSLSLLAVKLGFTTIDCTFYALIKNSDLKPVI